MYDAIRYGTAVYRNELAKRVQQIGYVLISFFLSTRFLRFLPILQGLFRLAHALVALAAAKTAVVER
jgi:hypothetical protein